MVDLLTNPLATPAQLLATPLPLTLRAALHYLPSQLLLSTGVLLSLPQPTIATALILLHRFHLLVPAPSHPLLATTHACLYLATKLTETPTKPRAIINATSYILHTPTSSPLSPREKEDAHVTEAQYFEQRGEMIRMEAELLKVQGFQTHVALPYGLIVNYLRTLECLDKVVCRRAWELVNDGLLAPGRVFLTCQPNAIAVAAVYIAAREGGRRLPEGWWEVFDVEREELGFLVVSLLGVKEFCAREKRRWEGREMPWGVEAMERFVGEWVEEMEE